MLVAAEIVARDLSLWCTSCALSSGVRTWYATRIGPSMTLRQVLHCRECGGRDVVTDPS